MSTAETYGRFVAGIFLVAIGAAGQTIEGGPPSVLIPAVGMAATESVEVNVSNMAPLPANGGAEPNCTGIILFYYSPSYSPTSVLPFAQATFSIASGQSFSFAVQYSSTGGTGGRQVIRPAINLGHQVAANGVTPACILVSSVETTDTATGVTHAAINPPPVSRGLDSGVTSCQSVFRP